MVLLLLITGIIHNDMSRTFF